jgi:isopenicillin N synthase-like dioxygenase
MTFQSNPRESLPEIDVGGFLDDPDGAPGRQCIERLRAACHDPGFCYIVGHRVPPSLDAAIMGGARAFFALDVDEKRRIAIVNSPHFRGYTALGGERTRGQPDWREQLDVGHEEPPVELRAGDPAWLRVRGPNQWPSRPAELPAVVLAWMSAISDLGVDVLRALAVGLGQPIDHFDARMLPRGDTHLKLIRYPARVSDADAGRGVGWHHDSGLLSFILQDAGGLEIATSERRIVVEPRPGAYVMNLGQMLEAATGGYLRATRSRSRALSILVWRLSSSPSRCRPSSTRRRVAPPRSIPAIRSSRRSATII